MIWSLALTVIEESANIPWVCWRPRACVVVHQPGRALAPCFGEFSRFPCSPPASNSQQINRPSTNPSRTNLLCALSPPSPVAFERNHRALSILFILLSIWKRDICGRVQRWYQWLWWCQRENWKKSLQLTSQVGAILAAGGIATSTEWAVTSVCGIESENSGVVYGRGIDLGAWALTVVRIIIIEKLW